MTADRTILRTPVAILAGAAVLVAAAVLIAALVGPLPRSTGIPLGAGFAAAGLTFATARIASRHRVTQIELYLILIAVAEILLPLIRY